MSDDTQAVVTQAEEVLKGTPLPDSRLTPRGGVTVKGSFWRDGRWWQPCFCANCGFEGAAVPEGMTFAFWLCVKCEAYGNIPGTVCEPDAQFFARVQLEQMETYGRLLTETEIATIVEADASPLSRLLKQGR